MHLVDVSGSEGRDPVEDFDTINNELQQYSPELASRAQIVIGNKTDLLGDDRSNIDRLKEYVESKGFTFLEMSAATHSGTRELIQTVADLLQKVPVIEAFEADCVPPEPVIDTSEDLIIDHEDDFWSLDGPWLQNLVASVNFNDHESLMWFDRILRDAGVFDRLESMGIQDGDTVSIYDITFEYQS